MAALRDDPEFGRFFEESYSRLVGVVQMLTGNRDAAEDAVQEAVARAWERRADIEHLERWVITTALNQSRSRWRKRRREVPTDRSSETSSTEPDHYSLDLRDAIAQLPRRQRQVILMHYGLDLSVADVAAVLSISDGGVKNALHEARKSLARSTQLREAHQ